MKLSGVESAVTTHCPKCGKGRVNSGEAKGMPDCLFNRSTSYFHKASFNNGRVRDMLDHVFIARLLNRQR